MNIYVEHNSPQRAYDTAKKWKNLNNKEFRLYLLYMDNNKNDGLKDHNLLFLGNDLDKYQGIINSIIDQDKNLLQLKTNNQQYLCYCRYNIVVETSYSIDTIVIISGNEDRLVPSKVKCDYHESKLSFRSDNEIKRYIVDHNGVNVIYNNNELLSIIGYYNKKLPGLKLTSCMYSLSYNE